MNLRKAFRSITLLLLVLVTAQFSAAQEAPSKDFDDYINKALKDWGVPGLAIAIVKNDQVVFARGYGVRKLGDSTPVDDKTLFAIGSSSKAFTAASVAMLMDEGKLKWDDPATKHLPGFQLFDPYVSREITVRDLLSHRSGLERGDLLWFGTTYSRDEIVRRVRYLKPVDGDDVVTWTNARMPSVGTDRKADLREIVLVECDSGAASDNERAVLPGLIDTVPDTRKRPDDCQQKRGNPDQLKEDQPPPGEVGYAVRHGAARCTWSLGAHCGIRRHDSLLPPWSLVALNSIWRPSR